MWALSGIALTELLRFRTFYAFRFSAYTRDFALTATRRITCISLSLSIHRPALHARACSRSLPVASFHGFSLSALPQGDGAGLAIVGDERF
ncbi:hypothetical protein KCP73_23475 [Salmonella enterica subsp. enterica]|nr:hypothetical protein KCP73_23475 [Salmonella enterica subsp. enterica]